MRAPIRQLGCAKASAGVALAKVLNLRFKKGPPEAVSQIFLTAARSTSRSSCQIALCSLSTGKSWAARLGDFKPSAAEQVNIEKLVKLKNVYRQNKFLDRNGGNFSFRAFTGLIIKKTGIWVDKVTVNDFVRVVYVNDDKVYYEGDALPSSECRSHYLVYQNVASVKFIFHAHAALIDTKQDLSGEIGWLPDMSYGTIELARAIAERAQNTNFIIAQNHGIFAFGRTYQETLKTLVDKYAYYRDLKK